MTVDMAVGAVAGGMAEEAVVVLREVAFVAVVVVGEVAVVAVVVVVLAVVVLYVPRPREALR